MTLKESGAAAETLVWPAWWAASLNTHWPTTNDNCGQTVYVCLKKKDHVWWFQTKVKGNEKWSGLRRSRNDIVVQLWVIWEFKVQTKCVFLFYMKRYLLYGQMAHLLFQGLAKVAFKVLFVIIGFRRVILFNQFICSFQWTGK